MSLANVLLHEGAELDLETDMSEVMSTLEDEVPKFRCDGYGFQVVPLDGVLGSSWRLLVNLRGKQFTAELPPRVGLIEVNKQEPWTVNLRVIPRDPWRDDQAMSYGEEGRFFASFVFQLVDVFRSKSYFHLAG